MITRVKTKHQLNSVLIGMLLGKSNLSINKHQKKADLETSHPVNEKEYLLWKQNLISGYFTTSFELIENNKDLYFQLKTKSEKHLYYLYRNFYSSSGVKIVKKNILNRVTDLSLAIWYMDNGDLNLGKKDGLINRRNIFLNTQKFELAGNLLIQNWLLAKYSLESNINQNHGYRLRLNTSNTQKLIEIVEPYVSQVSSCMMSKIDLKYKGNNRVQENSKRRESSLN